MLFIRLLLALLLLAPLAGCSGRGRLKSLLEIGDFPTPTYDNGNYSAADEDALRRAIDRKWTAGVPFWQVAADVLATNAKVEPPSKRKPTDEGPNPYSRQPQTPWVVRFGPNYIEVLAGEFAWYGVWWYTILLEFDSDGALQSREVFSDNLTL